MSLYLSYFVDGQDQFLTLFSLLLLWLAMAGMGAVVAGKNREYEATPLYGWAVVAVIFTFAGVLGIAFTYVAWLLLAIALPATLITFRRHGGLLAAGSYKVLIMGLPLMLITTAMVASQWDEFSHWLPASRFLLQYDAFPSIDHPVTGSPMIAGYPYNLAFITYLTGYFAGHMLEGSVRLLNVLMLMTFGLVAVKLAVEGAGRKMPQNPGWVLCALAFMGATLLNPTFVQKIVLTAYADTPTAVLVAFSLYICWRLLEALSSEDNLAAWRLAWQFSLLALVMINIKQANLVLFVMVLGGTVLIALRDPDIRFGQLIKLLPLMTVPPLALYMLWHYYVATKMAGMPGTELTLRPFDQWNIHLIPLIVKRMLLIASKKGAYFLIQFAAVGFAIRALWRFRGSFDRLAILVATAFLGYNAFLLLTYVASFSEYDALRAASYWRYNMHLGLSSVIFAAYGVGILWRRFVAGKALPVWLTAMPVVLVVAAPMIFPYKLRFDLELPKPRINAAAFYAAKTIAMNKKLVVLDPKGDGASSVITRGRTNRPDVPFATYRNLDSVKATVDFLSKVPQDGYVIVHSVTPESNKAMGMELANNISYLMVRNNAGGWKILHTWDDDGRIDKIKHP